MHETYALFRQLDPQKIIETVQTLHQRIQERFPGAGLGKVIAELLCVARETVEKTRWIQRAFSGAASHSQSQPPEHLQACEERFGLFVLIGVNPPEINGQRFAQ